MRGGLEADADLFQRERLPISAEPVPDSIEPCQNHNFDPELGAALYDRYLDEWACADEYGLNVMLNEHHATSTNLNPSAAVALGALARVTKRARLLILGNPIGNRRDPVRVAEEMAMIDCYSHGRLDVGFVRSAPYEFSATNSPPARMVDRLWEAHDLILKAWTTHDGPFNWEGQYFTIARSTFGRALP